jgi:predicted dehydrogenase
MPQPLHAGVIGVGYLGRFHAQKWASLPGARLVGIADPHLSARERAAAEFGVPVYEHYTDLLDKVAAVSIVTPTPNHYAIAAACAKRGIHVLLEKPMTETVAQAKKLIAAFSASGAVLQIGHLERFNAAILALEGQLGQVRFIESVRLAPFRERGTDVSVVLDLMIHDIDLIQSIVRVPLHSIEAIGRSVFSQDLDIANARLQFKNGCVANVTASRISLKTERKIRVFEDDAYWSVDLQQKILTQIRRGAEGYKEGLPQVAMDERTFEQGDALRAEIESFVDAIVRKRQPVVTGTHGLEALTTAIKIAELVSKGGRWVARG